MLCVAGVVELVSDFVVCEEGRPLSPEASRILVSVYYYYTVSLILSKCSIWTYMELVRRIKELIESN